MDCWAERMRLEMDRQKGKGISGSTLKMIAIISMLIDHVGAVLVYAALAQGYSKNLRLLYIIMRNVIGRLAFPIYCFLLVEGFGKTHSRLRYAARLLGFAILSEVPFDLAFSKRIVDPAHQNVFFTLFLGLLMIWVMEEIEKRKAAIVFKLSGFALTCLAAAVIAEAISCDYGAKGIIPIALLFLLRRHKLTQLIAGAAAFLWEFTASVAFLFVALYNGQRGWRIKYLFYFFYPVHLLILYFLYCAMFGR